MIQCYGRVDSHRYQIVCVCVCASAPQYIVSACMHVLLYAYSINTCILCCLCPHVYHILIHAYACVRVYVYVPVSVSMHVSVCMYVCVCLHMCVCSECTYVSVCMQYARICMSVLVCACVCGCVRMSAAVWVCVSTRDIMILKYLCHSHV